MKRFLALALGAALAAQAAAPVQAASHIDFNGYYRTYYLSDANLGRRTKLPPANSELAASPNANNDFTDRYFGHRLNLDITFSPTDELAVHWRLRGPDFERWGGQRDLPFDTYHIYGEIKQDWGTVLVGALDEDLDVYGLASLGYLPETNPVFTTVGPFEEAGTTTAVRFSREWDSGLSIMGQYSKVGNNGSEDEATGRPDNLFSDQDHDRFHVEGAYKWDGGGAGLGVWYERDATIFDAESGLDKTRAFYLNPAIMHSWGDFSVHFEGLAGWGKEEYGRDEDGRRISDVDLNGYAFYLDADYAYGDGNVTLSGWWASGSDLSDSDSNSLVSMGGNFFPLIVAYNDNASGFGRVAVAGDTEPVGNAVYLANTAYENYVHVGYEHTSTYLGAGRGIGLSTGTEGPVDNPGLSAGRFRRDSFNAEGTANHWALALSGNHAFTEDISMHYAVAYLALNKPNYRVADSWSVLYDGDGTIGEGGHVAYREQDKDLGFEIDLGFSFQLLDNLSFTTAFGYMFTGDAFKTLYGYRLTGEGNDGVDDFTNGQAVWKDGKDAYTWYNTLTINF